MNIELTREKKILEDGTVVFRIRAIKDFRFTISEVNNVRTPTCIKKGTVGGYVQKLENVTGDSWVEENAIVTGDTQLTGTTIIKKNNRVYGGIIHNSRIEKDSVIYGCEKITNTRISGNTKIFGEKSYIRDSWIGGTCHLKDVNMRGGFMYDVYVEGDVGVGTLGDFKFSFSKDYCTITSALSPNDNKQISFHLKNIPKFLSKEIIRDLNYLLKNYVNVGKNKNY